MGWGVGGGAGRLFAYVLLRVCVLTVAVLEKRNTCEAAVSETHQDLWAAARVSYVCILFAYVEETLKQRLRSSAQLWRINTAIERRCGASKCAAMCVNYHARTLVRIRMRVQPSRHPTAHNTGADFCSDTHSQAVLFLNPVNRRLNLASSFRPGALDREL